MVIGVLERALDWKLGNQRLRDLFVICQLCDMIRYLIFLGFYFFSKMGGGSVGLIDVLMFF